MTNQKRKLYLLFKNGDFSIAILFYWEGILKYSTIQPILGPQSVNLTGDFVQGTIFLFDQKSTFPSQLGFGSVVVSAATGQPYPEVPRMGPGWAANHQGRCFRTKTTGTTYATFENHGFKSAEKDMLVPRKIRCELAFPPCEPLGLWKLW